MACNKKCPKKEIRHFAGKGGQSVYLDTKSKSAIRIDGYKGVMFSGAGMKYIITSEGKISVYVDTSKGKVKSVLIRQGNEHDGTDTMQDIEKFQGVLIIVYHFENTLDEYHILYIDTRDDTYKNICFDTYGYEHSDVIGTLFEILSAPYLNVSNELVQDMRSTNFICDNSEQDAASSH